MRSCDTRLHQKKKKSLDRIARFFSRLADACERPVMIIFDTRVLIVRFTKRNEGEGG